MGPISPGFQSYATVEAFESPQVLATNWWAYFDDRQNYLRNVAGAIVDSTQSGFPLALRHQLPEILAGSHMSNVSSYQHVQFSSFLVVRGHNGVDSTIAIELLSGVTRSILVRLKDRHG